MYTKNDFISDLQNMELKNDDVVLVHSSIKKISGDCGIEGGPKTIIDALTEYFGEKGLVCFPALTWKLGFMLNDLGDIKMPYEEKTEGFSQYGFEYDVLNTPTHELGLLPELFRTYKGVVRSLSPCASICAFGKNAEEFCSGHDKVSSPQHWDSPWGKLYKLKAKTLFLGTGMGCNTFMHAIEERAEVPNLINDYVFNYTVIDKNGILHSVKTKRHEPGRSHYYHKVQEELIEQGIVKKYKFGSAESLVADNASEADYMIKKLKNNPNLFSHEFNKE